MAFGKALRGDLKGFWRYRVKDYRILCRIEEHRVVVIVIAVGHRSSIYEN
jgi:mRNA interferase RelE/StbE